LLRELLHKGSNSSRLVISSRLSINLRCCNKVFFLNILYQFLSNSRFNNRFNHSK